VNPATTTPGAAGVAVGRPDQAALSFDGVGLVYPDGTEALSDITLTVRPGEFVSLVGTSGCGKSSLLRIASGLLQPTSGSIRHDAAALGYVFQDPTLLPWRTVAQNIGLLAELRGIDKRRRRELVASAIARVGLSGFENNLPHTLSGGMRMRTSLARALTLEPGCFLFDEPFGALDELTRERLHSELLALLDARPFAGLFVTHSVSEAVFLSSRVIVMSNRPGRIAYELPIDFGYPRGPELRFDPAFARAAKTVSEALRDMAGSPSDSSPASTQRRAEPKHP
jgi:NitT/TauT family transport system ATP-binding protein